MNRSQYLDIARDEPTVADVDLWPPARRLHIVATWLIVLGVTLSGLAMVGLVGALFIVGGASWRVWLAGALVADLFGLVFWLVVGFAAQGFARSLHPESNRTAKHTTV